jgi:hypothetical protein
MPASRCGCDSMTHASVVKPLDRSPTFHFSSVASLSFAFVVPASVCARTSIFDAQNRWCGSPSLMLQKSKCQSGHSASSASIWAGRKGVVGTLEVVKFRNSAKGELFLAFSWRRLGSPPSLQSLCDVLKSLCHSFFLACHRGLLLGLFVKVRERKGRFQEKDARA